MRTIEKSSVPLSGGLPLHPSHLASRPLATELKTGILGGIRTPGAEFRRLTLCPLSYEDWYIVPDSNR